MKTCTYLLPIRRNAFSVDEALELRDYLSSLAATDCEVLVIDGSNSDVFAHHDRAWSGLCRHEGVDPRFTYLNDKVNGIHTGISLAPNEKIILADDDIRYLPTDLQKISALLDRFEVVRPQNYPSPLPWWARIEGARMLINRATLRTADYPGTCAFRRETILRAGEYDGDVLFDNEEIIRHLLRRRAQIFYASDFFVRKRPPAFRKWLEQRPRQAYEDFGLRAKTILFATLLPAFVIVGILLGAKALISCALAIAIAAIALALTGRTRGKAREFFPIGVCFWAPWWILERALSTYWAFWWYLTKGGYPFGNRLLRKGIGRDWVEGGRIASQIATASPPPE